MLSHLKISLFHHINRVPTIKKKNTLNIFVDNITGPTETIILCVQKLRFDAIP